MQRSIPRTASSARSSARCAADADYCWVIDPIDGTRAFIVGQPLWGTLIGLTRDGVPLLGLMDQPFVGERFFSGEREAFLRHGGTTRSMRTRVCPALRDALLTASSPDLFTTAEERERFATLERAVRLRRFGGDCYNYCLLALGQIDLVVEAGLQAYDILSLIPIIERAGGIVTHLGRRRREPRRPHPRRRRRAAT